jgi:acetoin utilization deacetylase AcuC-like enzyme
MTTLLYSHESSLQHEVPAGHPERPDRLRAVEKVLSDERFKKLVRKTPERVSREAVLRVHPADYYDAIERSIPEEGDLARSRHGSEQTGEKRKSCASLAYCRSLP